MEHSESKRLVRNTLFSVLTRGSAIADLILLVLAARYLGDEKYGQLSFAFAVVFIFQFVADFGLKDLLIREIARKKEHTRQWIKRALSIKAGLAVLTFVLVWITTLFLPMITEVQIVIWLLTFGMVIKMFKLLLRGVINAHERFDLEGILVLTERIMFLLVCGGLLVCGYGLVSFATGFAIIQFGTLMVWVFVIYRTLRGEEKEEPLNLPLLRVVKQAIPFGLSYAGMAVYFRLDSIMLGLIRGDVEVGWYNAAYRIIEGLLVIPYIFYNVLFPRFSILHQGSNSSIRGLTERGCKYLVALAIVITLIGVIGANHWIAILYGPGYGHAALALQILLLSTIFMFVWVVFVVLLNSINHPGIPLVGVLLGAATNTLLNFFLIPDYGYVGASVATVIADVGLVTFLYFGLVSCGYRIRFFEIAMKPIAVGLFVGLASLFLIQMNAGLLAILCGVMYVGVLLITGFLDQKEMTLLQDFAASLRLGFRRS